MTSSEREWIRLILNIRHILHQKQERLKEIFPSSDMELVAESELDILWEMLTILGVPEDPDDRGLFYDVEYEYLHGRMTQEECLDQIRVTGVTSEREWIGLILDIEKVLWEKEGKLHEIFRGSFIEIIHEDELNIRHRMLDILGVPPSAKEDAEHHLPSRSWFSDVVFMYLNEDISREEAIDWIMRGVEQWRQGTPKGSGERSVP